MRKDYLVSSLLVLTGALSGCSTIQPTNEQFPNELPPTATAAKEFKQGTVYRDYWLNITGNTVDGLRGDSRYPATPDGFDVLTKLQGPVNWGDNFGARVEALITPPASGEYTFYIASDDYAELWLSSDATPSKKQLIASVPGATTASQWSKYPQQISAKIKLEPGKRYYLEVVHKEGRYDDHFSVAWEGPGTAFQVIGGQAIAPYLPAVATGQSDDFVKGYTSGYRVGYDDARFGMPYTTSFPPKDTDKDGIPDNWEVAMGLNPDEPADALQDQDADLLSAYDEYVLRTDPNVADTDGDGIPDGYEAAYGFNPLLKADAAEDADGDGLSNAEEYLAKTDPTDPQSVPVASDTASGLKVEYWYSITGNNISNLTGHASFKQSPAKVEKLSRFELPVNTADNYGARISGYLVPQKSGDYTFYIASDDQSELYLSTDSSSTRKKLIASVSNAVPKGNFTKSAEQKSTTIKLEAGKAYYIEALYKEGRYDDHLQVAWEGPGITRQIISGEYLQDNNNVPTRPAETVQLVNGLAGQYFNDQSLTSFVTTRLDKTINFDWAKSSPMAGITADNFGVRWLGKVKPTHASGTKNYTFYVKADDGVRLWIDGKLLIDQWINQSSVEHSAVVPLTADKYHDIKVEYYENRYDARAFLSWQPEGESKGTIPASAFYSLDLAANEKYDADKDGMSDVWELARGLDAQINDAGTVLNSMGITALAAYQKNLNPWSGKADTGTVPIPDVGAPTLVWTAPVTRTDGTPLYPYEIDSYVLNYGASSTTMTKAVNLPGIDTSYSLKGYSKGTYSFSLTAVDTTGIKSAPSKAVSVTIK